MAKSDKNRTDAIRQEAAYQAQWNALFNSEPVEIVDSKRKGDDERCECGYHREACKFGTNGCPR